MANKNKILTYLFYLRLSTKNPKKLSYKLENRNLSETMIYMHIVKYNFIFYIQVSSSK